MKTSRRRLGSVSGLAAALLAAAAAAAPGATGATVATTSDPAAAAVATGDLLVDNYSFESGLDGWTASAGAGSGDACASAATSSTEHAVSGSSSLLLTASSACSQPTVTSRPVPVASGSTYTAYVHTTPQRGAAFVGLSFLDASGHELSAPISTPASADAPGVARVDGTAPAGAVQASVVLRATGQATFDDVLISDQATDLGPQLTVTSSANGTAYAVSPDGRDMAYAVMAGAHGVAARLAGVDLVSDDLVSDIPIPGAMGAWNAATGPDGKVYIGTYNYADPGVGGHLYSYVPGAAAVVDLGAPVPGDSFVYGITTAPDGTVFGGTYPSGTLWAYTAGQGFRTIGPRPISPGIQYVRSVAYDASTGLVFAGTATSSHIVACKADGTGTCAEILPATYSKIPWVYDMSAGDGHVFARVTTDHGEDHLVVIKASVAADGSIQSSVVNDLPGISYPGTSNVVDHSVYYAKAGALYRYDTTTETETNLGVGTGIFARTWEVRRMADQADFPGQTVVGFNSGGSIALYDIDTQKLVLGKAKALPKGIADIETIVGAPDGRVYSSGYLVGGLGNYAPMRSDKSVQVAGNKGYGQAEGMAVLGDRTYFGFYPGAHIRSVTPQGALTGAAPTAVCDIPDEQDRPYGMVSGDGKLYAGTMAVYGQNSGALTVIDPATGTCDVHRDVVHDQTIAALTFADHKVIGGSLVWGGLGSTPTQDEAKLVVFDPATSQSHTVDLPVRGLRAVTGLATAPDGGVWVMAQSWVMRFDPGTETWSQVHNAFPSVTYGSGPDARISAYDSRLVTAPNGQIYGAYHGRYLIRLDPATGQVSTLLEGAVQNVALDGYGNLYTVYDTNHLLRYVTAPLSDDND